MSTQPVINVGQVEAVHPLTFAYIKDKLKEKKITTSYTSMIKIFIVYIESKFVFVVLIFHIEKKKVQRKEKPKGGRGWISKDNKRKEKKSNFFIYLVCALYMFFCQKKKKRRRNVCVCERERGIGKEQEKKKRDQVIHRSSAHS